MKKVFLFSIALFLSVTGFCQDKGYVALSGGFSVPISDFASKDASNDGAGYALSGISGDVSFAYKFGKNFGLAMMLRQQFNAVDNQAVGEDIAKSAGVPFSNITSTWWKVSGLMAGGYASFPVSSKMSVDFKAIAGFMAATSPEETIYFPYNGQQAWVKLNTAKAYPFSYLVGVGYKYDLADRICFLMNFDYLGAKPEFNDVQITSSVGQTDSNTFAMKFATINVNVGIGFRL